MTPPNELLKQSVMSRKQWIAILVATLVSALDGYDVLTISFAAPGISDEYNIDQSILGVVLAAELIGMGIGSVFLGGLSDKIGRQKTILCCLLVMALSMLATPFANDIYVLSISRVITGIGIGGVLAAVTAAAAEHSNKKNQGLCVALAAGGYPIGAVVGGSIAAWLLSRYEWHSIFFFGGIVTLFYIPIVWLWMPETIAFLCDRQPRNSLNRVNKVLKEFGHNRIEFLPPVNTEKAKLSVLELFSPALIYRTSIVTLAYFFHIATLYFMLKWIPKIITDAGFSPSYAVGVLVWLNVGGVIGSLATGALSQIVSARKATIIAMTMSFIMVGAFGMGRFDDVALPIMALAAGLFLNAGVVGLYTLFTEVFPTKVRGAGTGFAIGFGRAGAAISPILAGFLFKEGITLQSVAIIMGLGSLLAVFFVWSLRYTLFTSNVNRFGEEPA